MKRARLAAAIGGLGVALAVALMVRQSGGVGGRQARVEMDAATAAQLDTVAVRGRVVRVSMDGLVTQIDAEGEVWLGAGGDAFPLRFPSDPEVSVEDHLLVTGRLRARGGQRWLAVSDWVRIRAQVMPPPNPEL